MIGLLLGLAVPLAILASGVLLTLGRAGRSIRRWSGAYFDDALTDNTRSHKIAVAGQLCLDEAGMRAMADHAPDPAAAHAILDHLLGQDDE